MGSCKHVKMYRRLILCSNNFSTRIVKRKKKKRGKRKLNEWYNSAIIHVAKTWARRGADEPGKSDKMIPEWWPTPDWVVQDAQIHHSVHRTAADRDATIKIATDKWVKHHCLWNQWPHRRLGKNDDDRRRRCHNTRWNENTQKIQKHFYSILTWVSYIFKLHLNRY